jgi:hypothetical protein
MHLLDREKYGTFSMLLPELADNELTHFFPFLQMDVGAKLTKINKIDDGFASLVGWGRFLHSIILASRKPDGIDLAGLRPGFWPEKSGAVRRFAADLHELVENLGFRQSRLMEFDLKWWDMKKGTGDV